MPADLLLSSATNVMTLFEKLQNLWPKIIITVSSCAAVLCVMALWGHPPDQVIKGLLTVAGVPESWRLSTDAVASWLIDPVRAEYVAWGSIISLIVLYFPGTNSELKERVDERGGSSDEVVLTRYGALSAYIFILFLLQVGEVATVLWIVLLAAVMCFFGIWRDNKRRRVNHSRIGTWAYGWFSGVISPPLVLISLLFSLLSVFAGKIKR